jgi:hypothetical protein
MERRCSSNKRIRRLSHTMQGGQHIQFLNHKRPKLKAEIGRLVSYGVLRKTNRSEWTSLIFTVTKKDQTLRSIADLRRVNKRIQQKPYPILKDPRFTTQTQRLSTGSFSGFERGVGQTSSLHYYYLAFVVLTHYWHIL